MKLPCGHELPAADLASLLPEAVILQAAGSISSARRITIGRKGGRKPLPTPCPRCGVECPSFTSAREHCRKQRAQKRLSPLDQGQQNRNSINP